MYILLTGLSHHTAPLLIREKLALNTHDIDVIYQEFRKNSPLEGIFILTTCNRTEIYATARSIEGGQRFIREYFAQRSGVEEHLLSHHLYQLNCYEAVEHLFRVASGLDSMILGETQILGQLKEAYYFAHQRGATNSILNQLFQKAVMVGKKIRTETAIDQHPVSISYIAVELARELLGELSNKSVLVVGAGETGELATRHLLANGVKSVLVSNRSHGKAVELAESFGGGVVRFDHIDQELRSADIVISCTAASHYVIHGESCRQALLDRQGKDIVFIDIAVPRDVDPALTELSGVHIYDIDRLQNVVDIGYEARRCAAKQAEGIIAHELAEFETWLNQLCIVPVLSALTQKGEKVRQRELNRALNRLGAVSAREERVITEMSQAIVNQLLRDPIHALKDMAMCEQNHIYTEMTKRLYDLKTEDEEQRGHASS